MKRMMLILLSVLSLSGCNSLKVTPPIYQEIETSKLINVEYSTAWDRLVYWCIKDDTEFKEINKELGYVRTWLPLSNKYLDCGTADAGWADYGGARVNILLTPKGSQTLVTVELIDITATWVHYTNQIVPCSSNGVFEKEFFEYIESGKYTRPIYSNPKKGK